MDAPIDIADYLRDQLVFIRRRATPEERARINWWINRTEALKAQEPKAEPLPAATDIADHAA